MRRLGAIAGLVAACAAFAGAVALSIPLTASACGCGSWNGPTIARGVSPGGVKWRIWVVKHGRRNFSVEFGNATEWPVNYSNPEVEGFGSGLPTGGARGRWIEATPGSGFGPENESDLAGMTTWRAKEVVITMRSGNRIRFKPAAAPKPLRDRWPWIKGYRFFDQYFNGKEKPVKITALNAAGKAIASQR